MIRRFLLGILLLACAALPASAQTAKRPWDKETLELFGSLPVQDGGRVKPLSTLAGFKLLKINGKRSCAASTVDGAETLGPTEWLLDCVFFPDAAADAPFFLVQNAEVLDDIELSHENKRRRDRYTFRELEPAIDKLGKKSAEYAAIPDKDQTLVQSQVVQLAHNVRDFLQLRDFLDFARADYPLRGSEGLKKIFPDAGARGLALLLQRAPLVSELHEALNEAKNLDPAVRERELASIRRLVEEVDLSLRGSGSLAIFPPPSGEQWLSPVALADRAFRTTATLGDQIALVGALERLERSKSDAARFRSEAAALHAGLTGLATARGEYGKVPIEVVFYKADFFYNALVLFGLGFLLIAIDWLRSSKWLRLGSIGFTSVATLLLVAGIVFRCIIRSRPPVSTLYETILFITAVAVIVCGGMEWINRQGIARAVAPFLGMAGMFLANKYEFNESVTAGDTMPSLVAVLDTNFWLSTHVTSVTMGYAAGLLASAIAHVWLLGKMLGLKKDDAAFYKSTARMVYGVLCFGLLFSVVGTILGGIWANYSWGRFWGWDPKENGALMICLWGLMILHARMGGYIRDYGLAVLAIFGGMVVAFSWWGVNLLNVGLHSYGFTSGVFNILLAFYGAEVVLILGSVVWRLSGALLERALDEAQGKDAAPA